MRRSRTASIPLRAVRVLAALGESGSVTQAALNLGISPGAVTQHVHALERYLGVRLVERSGQGVALTEWGRRYLPYAREAMAQLQQGEQELQRARRSHHLVVSAFPSVSDRWLGPMLFEWKALHPDSSIFLQSSETEPRLQDNEADFRISYGSRARFHQRYRNLFTDYFIPVGSPALLGARGMPAHAEDILKFPLIWIDWGGEYTGIPTWQDWLANFGIARSRVPCDLTYSLSSAALESAIQGHGLVLAQFSMLGKALAERTLVRLFEYSPPLPEPYFLAWSSASLEKPLGVAFQAWLTAQARRFDWSGTQEDDQSTTPALTHSAAS